jgi:hypothetical protein
MEKNSTTDATPLFVGEAWFDPIEAELRERVRGNGRAGGDCGLPERHALAATVLHVWTAAEVQGLLLNLAYGRVRSCVRPLARPMTAGPDGVRRTSPKHGCGMEVPLQQAGFPVRRFDRLPSLASALCSAATTNGQAACGVRR